MCNYWHVVHSQCSATVAFIWFQKLYHVSLRLFDRTAKSPSTEPSAFVVMVPIPWCNLFTHWLSACFCCLLWPNVHGKHDSTRGLVSTCTLGLALLKPSHQVKKSIVFCWKSDMEEGGSTLARSPSWVHK